MNELEQSFSNCPVKVGDRFYHELPKMTLPDLIEVKEIKQTDDGHYIIRGKYLYHAIGPEFERNFSDMIFKDPSWVIVPKERS